MNWLTKLFHSFRGKNKEPTLGEEISPQSDGTVSIEEVNGTYILSTNTNKPLFDSEISRACIHRIATECSKALFKPTLTNKRIENLLSVSPNPFQGPMQFIEQVITITLADNNCFIVPILNRYDQVTGIWAVSPSNARWVNVENGDIYLRYTLEDTGQELLIEQERVGQMRRMVHNKALMGESNAPFSDGAKLYDMNTQRSINLLEANKDPIRWKAKLNHTLASDETDKIESNLATVNKVARKTGVMVTDARYESFEPFTRPVAVMKPEDVAEMRKAAYIYWGCSEKILTNSYTEDEWNGFYQSAIEPLLIQLSQVLSKVLYSYSQRKSGNSISFDSGRLQYASIKSRMNVAFGAFDRGMASINSALQILNLEPLPDNDAEERYIRGEYRTTDERREGTDDGRDNTFNDSGGADGSDDQKNPE